MAAGETIVKLTSFGEGGLRKGLAGLLQVADREGALQVYRIIAVGCGVCFILLTAAVARHLFTRNLDRLLFTIGLATGGYALLFFGYVEQYSIFVLAVAAFVLIGVLIALGQVNRWWVVPLLLVTATMHVFGVMLLPAALYLLLADTSVSRRLQRARPMTWTLLAIAVVIVVVVVGRGVFEASVFLRYALIPVTDNMFAYDHYSLLAPAHLIDSVNLTFLLLPATALLLYLFTRQKLRSILRGRPAVFLAVTIFSAFGGLFWIDPKLGLPRDWDLFSFAGVPLAALFYWLALANTDRSPQLGRSAAVLGIVLGCISLGARVAILQLPDAGIAQHRAYLALDRDRGLRAYYLLSTYYENEGDSVAAAQARDDWHATYPEREVFFRGLALKNSGQLVPALREFRTATRMNSTFADPWSHMGECYMRLNLSDSAEVCFLRALRFNPYEAAVWNNIGNLYLRSGRLEKAERCLMEAHRQIGEDPANLYNLASLCRLTGRMDQYFDYLTRAARFAEAPPGLHKELANYYVTSGNLRSAAEQYRIGLAKGLDTTFVREVIRRFPALAPLVPLE